MAPKVTQSAIEIGKGFVVSKFTKEGQKSVHLKQLTTTDYSTGSEFNDVSLVSATENQVFRSYRTAILPCDDWYTEGDVLKAVTGMRIGRILASEPIISSRQRYMMSQKNEDGSPMLTFEQIMEKQLIPELEKLTAAEKKAGKVAKPVLNEDGTKKPQLDKYDRRQYRLLTVVLAGKPDSDLRLDFPIEEELVREVIPMEESGDFEE